MAALEEYRQGEKVEKRSEAEEEPRMEEEEEERRPDERGSHAMTFRPSFLTRRRRERPLSGSSRALGLESKERTGSEEEAAL